MVICKFFLEGRCRFGERCFNEHVTDRGYQQNRYSERQRYESPPRYSDHQRYQSPIRNQDQHHSSSYQYDSRQNRSYSNYGNENRANNNRYERNDSPSPNPYSWKAPEYKQQKDSFNPNRSRYDSFNKNFGEEPRGSFNQQSRNRYDVLSSFDNRDYYGIDSTKLDVLKEDVICCEKGKQWPFSCYFPFKGHPGFPEFEDISPEELRYEAYEAERNNTFQEYVRSYNKALDDWKRRCEMLKNPRQNPHIINAVKKILSEDLNLETDRVKKQLFFGGANETSTNSQQFTNPSRSFFSGQASSFGSGSTFKLSHLTSGSSGNTGSLFGKQSSDKSTASEMETMSIESSATPKPHIASTPSSSFKFGTRSTDQGKTTSAADDKSGSNIYSRMEDLTKEELEAFSAPTFIAGKIPTRPPPQSMCF